MKSVDRASHWDCLDLDEEGEPEKAGLRDTLETAVNSVLTSRRFMDTVKGVRNLVVAVLFAGFLCLTLHFMYTLGVTH